MQKLEFSEAVDLVVSQNPQFDRDAYYFLRDALDFTVNQIKKNRSAVVGHVSGQQLLEGIRHFAIKQFGPMVPTVLNYWNIHQCEDFGTMVYRLIEAGVFGKSERDSLDDFKGGYSFHDAFVVPYQPAARVEAPKRVRRREPAKPRAKKSSKSPTSE
jgi:uncharacterized repeat protein (TIGR04138 family)